MAKFTGKGAEFLINTAAIAPATYTAVAQVQEIGDLAITSDEVEVTTLDAGDYRQYIQGFKDPGECQLTLIFDPALASHGIDTDGIVGLFTSGEVKQCAIKLNSSETDGHSFMTFDAFIRDFTYNALNPDDPQTAAPVFRITGPVDLVDALPTTMGAPVTPAVTLNPTSNPSGLAAGETGKTIAVTTTATDPWTAATTDPWITITAPTGPTTGNGSVTYNLAANGTGASRSGSITVGDKTFAITQAG